MKQHAQLTQLRMDFVLFGDLLAVTVLSARRSFTSSDTHCPGLDVVFNHLNPLLQWLNAQFRNCVSYSLVALLCLLILLSDV